MAAARPLSVRIRAYQVGFGDCFLLTFRYRRGMRRHVLVDFGSTALPKTAPKDALRRIADDIRAECRNGKEPLAVVATHRHQDHVSGFATNRAGTAPGDVIRACKPRLVVQPWTEDPRAKPTARGPSAAAKRSASSARIAGVTSRARGVAGATSMASLMEVQAFVGALDSMSAVAANVVREAELAGAAAFGDGVTKQLHFLGSDNVKNRSAVENLMTMAPNDYVFYGSKTRLARFLPGVNVDVLGPPTLAQSAGIAKMRSRDEAEFWHLQALAGAASTATGVGRSPVPLFPGAATIARIPPVARWFQRRLRAARGKQLLGLVRALDKAMNNTSLILLFTVGKKRLLFPGDAQIENWRHALADAKDSATVRRKLAGVSVYKVGHHGSLNATPKTLWGLFKGRSKRGGSRLRSLLSTMAGKHGSAQSKTEVPRRTLVGALKRETKLTTTQAVRSKKQLCVDVELDF